MRKSIVTLLAVLVSVLLWSKVSAVHGGWFDLNHCWPDVVGRRCCDTYDRKHVPCARPVKLFQCDDYCPKKVPCAKKVHLFGCDDYCRKCVPVPSCPSPMLKCVLGHPQPCGCRGQR